jgi:hypothetical protein
MPYLTYRTLVAVRSTTPLQEKQEAAPLPGS